MTAKPSRSVPDSTAVSGSDPSGAVVSGGAGLLAFRESDNAPVLIRTDAGTRQGSRTGQITRHGATALLRQSISSRRAGSEALIDAERLPYDPALRMGVLDRIDRPRVSPVVG